MKLNRVAHPRTKIRFTMGGVMLVVCALFQGLVQAASTPPDPATFLEAAYPMSAGNSLVDTTGHFPGQLTAFDAQPFAMGPQTGTSALNFGAKSVATILLRTGSGPTVSFDTLTFTTWFKSTAGGQPTTIASGLDTVGSTWTLGADRNGVPFLTLTIFHGQPQQLTGSGDLYDGKWHQLIATVSSHHARLFVDQTATEATVLWLGSKGQSLVLGSLGANSAFTLGPTQLYSQPLTLSMISGLTGVTYRSTSLVQSQAVKAAVAATTPTYPYAETTINLQAGGSGTFPNGNLIEDSAGNFYGTGRGGPAYSSPGGIFELVAPNLSEVDLNGSQSATGYYPETGLVMDPAGNFYGTYSQGPDGSTAAGQFFSFSLIHPNNFSEIDLTDSPIGIMRDTSGNIFLTGSSTVIEVPYANGTLGPAVTLYDLGSQPSGNLIMDAQKNLYGVTEFGGTDGDGMVYELPYNNGAYGTEITLHNFTGGSDGMTPSGSLTFDSAGNLFGATLNGGANSAGTVFEIPHGASGYGAEKIIYSFNPSSDGIYPNGSLIFDAAGNIYGTTQAGGDAGVFELPYNSGLYGTEKILYSFQEGIYGAPTTDGFAAQPGLILDGAGELIGTTVEGGDTSIYDFGAGTVFILKPYATVTAVTPASGSTSGGTTVTVTGNGFSGTTQVLFGTKSALSFTVQSPTQLVATSPANAVGTDDITVTTPLGTSSPSVADQFTYQAQITALPVITSSKTLLGSTTSALSYAITASNNPTSYAATGLPAGLSINATTGVISGTPSGAGSTLVHVTATNAAGSASSVLTISVYAFALTDSDANGLADAWETKYFGHKGNSASTVDPNGLTTLQSYQYGLDPTATNTLDTNGISYAWEVQNYSQLGLDPYGDPTGSGYPNIYRYSHNVGATGTPIPDIVVDAAGSTAYTTIQSGIDATTKDYQIILVKPGTYAETPDISAFKTLICSSGGAVSTVINAQQSYGVYVSTDSVIEGITLSNVYIAGYICYNNATARLSNDLVIGSNLYYGAFYTTSGGTILATNCTVAGNSIPSGYAAIDSPNITLVNTILWDGGNEIASGLTNISATYCDIQGSTVFAGVGNLNSNPNLQPDGHLTAGSPCLDKGTAIGAPNYDMDNEARPQGAGYDIGADEYLDTNGQGLPNWWQLKYFKALGQSPSTLSPNGDKLTNLQNYQQQIDPINPIDTNGISYAWEVQNYNQLHIDPYQDVNGNGYPNIYKYLHGVSSTGTPTPDIVVDAAGSTAYKTIQSGIDATTKDYQIILVKPGTYTENSGIFNFKTLIKSSAGAALTIVNAQQGYGPEITKDSIIEGLTITNASNVAYFCYNNAVVRLSNDLVIGSTLYYGAFYTTAGGTILATNCTVTGNTIPSGYDAVFSPNVTLVNTILWDGGNEIASGLTNVSATYCDIQGTTVFPGAGNLNSNPNVRSDGHLIAGSPCIDKGTTLGAPHYDMDNEARPQAAGYDIGADEYLDSKNDGVPDWWEVQNGIALGTLGSTLAPAGNGLTLLQDYQQSNNPNNYYSQNGQIIVPALTMVSGNNQSGPPSSFLAQPLVVKVATGTTSLINAPVTFTVTSGGLAITSSGSTVPALTTRTNSSGTAQVYYALPVGVSGSFQVQVTTGTASPLSFSATIVLPPPPAITSATAASTTVGIPFSYTITATNTPKSYAATGLPAGLTLSSTGIISGTPTIVGKSTITLSAINAGGTGTATLILTVNPPLPVISSATTATTQVGKTFSYTIAASNSPTSYAATGLPAGLSINATTGVISGTPTTAATSTITLNATNAGGTGTAKLILTINPPTPVISSATTATAQVGQAFSYTVTASNSPTSYAATGLPAGLSLNTSTGALTGTPTTAGKSSITLSATNAGGTGTATLTLTVNPPTPVISSATSATGTTGTAFSYTIVASNSPTNYSAAGLPAGLTINASTGVISGTPTTVGKSIISMSAINAGGTGTATLTLTVNPPAPVISSATTATAQVGQAFSYSITASNSPTGYAATGLPAGLSLNTSTGALTGTPTIAATSTITLSATNAGGTGTTKLTLTVNPPTPVISSATTATAQVGQAFSYTVTASNSPTSYAATGLPAGLAINQTTGLISGTPTTVAALTITLSATNTGGTGSATITLTITLPMPTVQAMTVGGTARLSLYAVMERPGVAGTIAMANLGWAQQLASAL